MMGENLLLEKVDEKLIVEVTKDRMFAIIYFEEAENDGMRLSLSNIKDELRKRGVVAGIDDDLLNEIDKNRISKFKYIVAQGKKPQDGEPAKIEYYFDIEKLSNFKPTENVDGSVDFKELSITHNVKKGEVLLKKIPATNGIDGFNVHNVVVKSKKGKDIKLGRGKNTQVSPDGLSVTASKDGQLVYDGNGVSVSELFVVEGDVDSSTGNIDFIGSVLVNGSVYTGFSIRAGGNVEVRGSVEDATIISEGDIILRYGIQGGEKGKLEAKGNVIAKFIQNSKVDAGKDIVSEAVLHSKISAGNAIKIDSGKGSIVGGESLATNFITVNTIGSPMATATKIRMGVNPNMYNTYKQLEEEIVVKKDELNKVSQSITFLMTKSKTTQLTDDKKKILEKLIRSKMVVASEYESMSTEYNSIQEAIKQSQNGVIKVKDKVYPGVKVGIGSAIRYILEEVQFCTIQKIGPDIEIGSYS